MRGLSCAEFLTARRRIEDCIGGIEQLKSSLSDEARDKVMEHLRWVLREPLAFREDPDHCTFNDCTQPVSDTVAGYCRWHSTVVFGDKEERTMNHIWGSPAYLIEKLERSCFGPDYAVVGFRIHCVHCGKVKTVWTNGEVEGAEEVPSQPAPDDSTYGYRGEARTTDRVLSMADVEKVLEGHIGGGLAVRKLEEIAKSRMGLEEIAKSRMEENQPIKEADIKFSEINRNVTVGIDWGDRGDFGVVSVAEIDRNHGLTILACEKFRVPPMVAAMQRAMGETDDSLRARIKGEFWALWFGDGGFVGIFSTREQAREQASKEWDQAMACETPSEEFEIWMERYKLDAPTALEICGGTVDEETKCLKWEEY